jgi:hypothetical protein
MFFFREKEFETNTGETLMCNRVGCTLSTSLSPGHDLPPVHLVCGVSISSRIISVSSLTLQRVMTPTPCIFLPLQVSPRFLHYNIYMSTTTDYRNRLRPSFVNPHFRSDVRWMIQFFFSEGFSFGQEEIFRSLISWRGPFFSMKFQWNFMKKKNFIKFHFTCLPWKTMTNRWVVRQETMRERC